MFNIISINNINLYKKYKNIIDNKLQNQFIKHSFSIDYNEFLLLIINPDISKYKDKINNLKEDFLRSRADLENFKKRSNDDLAKAYKYAIEDFCENLLFVLDSLEAALIDKSNNIEKLSEGVRLTLKLLINVLEKNQVTNILPLKGDIFNPHKHLAISTIKFNDESNTVVNTLQKGYSICDRILRPALVVVSKVD